MRTALPALLCLFLGTATAFAQTDRFAYAITDLSPEGTGWNVLRRLDLRTGQFSSVLLNGTDQRPLFDAVSRKPLSLAPDARFGTLLQLPFATGVAAAAYDKAHNRLYFTPMFADQLRYIDLRTLTLYCVTGQPFSGAGDMHNNEAKIITRMVMAPDGYGYAINNDGTALVRFSTGKKALTEQLGPLVDDAANNGVSIHNRCTSFGGDMVADEAGNLFLFTARNQVFRINTSNRVATHLGAISGLPQNFTTNGAVVDGDGTLLVSSAVEGKAYYVIDPANWSASPYTGANSVFRSSDLANSNLLRAKKQNTTDPASARLQEEGKRVAVYPNPVHTGRLSVQFTKMPAGNYTVELTDMLGRSVSQQRVVVNSEWQVQPLTLKSGSAKGVYLLKVYDTAKQTLFTQKVMVE